VNKHSQYVAWQQLETWLQQPSPQSPSYEFNCFNLRCRQPIPGISDGMSHRKQFSRSDCAELADMHRRRLATCDRIR